MRKIVKRTFWAWQADNEEKWINEMSAKGWQLVAVGLFRYEFEKGEPNEYAYRLELLEYWPTHKKSVEYIQFVEETGADCFATVKRWAYFRKRTADGPFDLFSDVKGRLSLNTRYLQLLGVLFFVELMYLPPAFALLFTHFNLATAVVIGFNAFMAILVVLGLVKILRKRKLLRREQAIVE